VRLSGGACLKVKVVPIGVFVLGGLSFLLLGGNLRGGSRRVAQW
jgi:hypothetical protein